MEENGNQAQELLRISQMFLLSLPLIDPLEHNITNFPSFFSSQPNPSETKNKNQIFIENSEDHEHKNKYWTQSL